jgi:hypothetical protein
MVDLQGLFNAVNGDADVIDLYVQPILRLG